VTTQTTPQPGTKYQSPRAGFRRALLVDLRTAKSYLQDVLIPRWGVRSDVFDDTLKGRPRRWRRHHEYPENSASTIEQTARDLRQLALFLTSLADRLDAQARRIEDQ